MQPAFPGMPQAPAGPGAPSDIGPDGGVMPPDALPPEAGIPPADGAEEDAEDGGNPFGGDGEELPPDDGSVPPEDGEEEDEGPPPPPPKGKKKAARYRSLDGTTAMDEDQFARHVAAELSGHDPEVLAAMRAVAGAPPGTVISVLDESTRRAFWDSDGR